MPRACLHPQAVQSWTLRLAWREFRDRSGPQPQDQPVNGSRSPNRYLTIAGCEISGLVANTMEPLIAMAERGLGLVYTPIFMVRSQIAAGTLQPVLAANLCSQSTIQVLWPPGRHTSPKVRAFVDFMAMKLLST